MIAVVCTVAAADLARANVPPTLVLPLTLTVPKKPELPVIVAVLNKLLLHLHLR